MASSGGKRGVGAMVLKEQLTELRQESAVLLELQNRLDRSIETLKMHKKQTSHTSPGSREEREKDSERTLLQFINNLSSDEGVDPVGERGVASTSTGAMGTFTPLNQRRQLFEYDEMNQPNTVTANKTTSYTDGYVSASTTGKKGLDLGLGLGNYSPGLHTAPRSAYARTDMARMETALEHVTEDLWTKSDYQQKLFTNSLELESATNRMAKQELEIYTLRQKCNAMERIVASKGLKMTKNSGASAQEKGKGSGASASGGIRGGRGTTSAKPARTSATHHGNRVDLKTSGLSSPTSESELDSKILQRWGFSGEDGGKSKNTKMGTASAKFSPSSSSPSFAYPSPSTATARATKTPEPVPMPWNARVGASRQSPSSSPLSKGGLPSSYKTSSNAHANANVSHVHHSSNVSPSPQERFLQSEIIKRDRELHAMSSVLDDLTTSQVEAEMGELGLGQGLGQGLGFGLSPSAARTTRTKEKSRNTSVEAQLQYEMKQKDEVINAMSSTIDQLILEKSSLEQKRLLEKKERAAEAEAAEEGSPLVGRGSAQKNKKSEREQELEDQVKRKDAEMQALTATLDQMGLLSSANQEREGERERDLLQKQIRDKQLELQTLTSTLNGAVLASSSSPVSFKSPTAGGGRIPSPRAAHSWTDVSAASEENRHGSVRGGSGGLFDQLSSFAPASATRRLHQNPPPSSSSSYDALDPFAEIRLATRKLQDAQSTLQQSIGGKPATTSKSKTRTTASAKPARAQKPKMYYV